MDFSNVSFVRHFPVFTVLWLDDPSSAYSTWYACEVVVELIGYIKRPLQNSCNLLTEGHWFYQMPRRSPPVVPIFASGCI